MFGKSFVFQTFFESFGWELGLAVDRSIDMGVSHSREWYRSCWCTPGLGRASEHPDSGPSEVEN